MDGASVLKLVLIAGGPCSGKTSIVSRLAEWLRNEGYSVYVIRDWAREIIRREKPKGDKGILPWTDRAGFEREVAKEYLREYKRLFDNPLVEYDIVLEDSGGFATKAYCQVDDVDIPREFYELMRYHDRVSLVILLDFPRSYHIDSERWEELEYARRIHEEIVELHKEIFRDKVYMIEYMDDIDAKAKEVYRLIKEKLGL